MAPLLSRSASASTAGSWSASPSILQTVMTASGIGRAIDERDFHEPQSLIIDLFSSSRLVTLPPMENPFADVRLHLLDRPESTICAPNSVRPSSSTRHSMAVPAADGWCISRTAPHFI